MDQEMGITGKAFAAHRTDERNLPPMKSLVHDQVVIPSKTLPALRTKVLPASQPWMESNSGVLEIRFVVKRIEIRILSELLNFGVKIWVNIIVFWGRAVMDS